MENVMWGLVIWGCQAEHRKQGGKQSIASPASLCLSPSGSDGELDGGALQHFLPFLQRAGGLGRTESRQPSPGSSLHIYITPHSLLTPTSTPLTRTASRSH